MIVIHGMKYLKTTFSSIKDKILEFIDTFIDWVKGFGEFLIIFPMENQ
jgi:hypothetical protein